VIWVKLEYFTFSVTALALISLHGNRPKLSQGCRIGNRMALSKKPPMPMPKLTHITRRRHRMFFKVNVRKQSEADPSVACWLSFIQEESNENRM
jgi:hypothetical protein